MKSNSPNNKNKFFIYIALPALMVILIFTLSKDICATSIQGYTYTMSDLSRKDFLNKIYYDTRTPLDQQVVILTDFGSMVIRLLPNKSPYSTEVFVKLIRSGYYNTTFFYRVIDHYILQAGDTTNLGIGNAGFNIPDESKYSDSPVIRGSVALANINNDPTKTGSQFFISFTRAKWLDNKYNIVGYVISGIDIFSSLFDKYTTSSYGVVTPPIPFRIYVLSDLKSLFPEALDFLVPISDPMRILNNTAVIEQNEEYNKLHPADDITPNYANNNINYTNSLNYLLYDNNLMPIYHLIYKE